LHTGWAFGLLVFIAPLLCMALSFLVLGDATLAAVMGLLMLPSSFILSLFMWQGFAMVNLWRDAFRLLYLHRTDGLRGGYYDGTPFSRVGRKIEIPSGAALIPIPVTVCAVYGFMGAMLYPISLFGTVALYATLGFVYGVALYGILWFMVLPLLVEARRL
jgi:hypothetical protein